MGLVKGQEGKRSHSQFFSEQFTSPVTNARLTCSVSGFFFHQQRVHGMWEPGMGVRPLGWTGGDETDDEGPRAQDVSMEAPEEAIQQEKWQALNQRDEGENGTNDQAPAEIQEDEGWIDRGQSKEMGPGSYSGDDGGDSRRNKRKRRYSGSRESTTTSGESESNSDSNDSGRSYRRRSSRQKKKKRGHRQSRRSKRRENYDKQKFTIAQLWKNCAMPALKDDATHDEMRLAWPTWRDMLIELLNMHRPPDRDWTEDEKFMALMMRGGRHIHEIAAFTTAVAGEVAQGENGKPPKFSNLVKRCDTTYGPKDVTMEVTILRAMHQKEDESVREFLNKARKQVTLCGYRGGEEKDRELMMLLKENTIDAREISKQAAGQSLEQMEAVAVNLEAIRAKEKREKKRADPPVAKEEVDVHAVWEKFKGWASQKQPERDPERVGQDYRSHQRSQQQAGQANSADKCSRCHKYGGHQRGEVCRALNMECYNCGRMGHTARACRSGARAGKDERKGRPRQRVHQVGSRAREEHSEDNQVKSQVGKWDD